MSILNNVTRGRISEPVKVVIYGPQGIGKSTLASLFPSPLFLDTEEGTRRLHVDRLQTNNLDSLSKALTELTANGPEVTGFQTIILDTLDWAESRMKEQVVKTFSAKERSYGREESFVADVLTRYLDQATHLVRAGYNVVLLAHSTIAKIDLPDQPSAYDHYELDMGRKHCAPMVKHWADHLLFLRWQLAVREPEEGRNKAVGKGKRLLCFTQAASYDAKSRSTLTGELVLPETPEECQAILKRLFADVGAPWGSDAPAAPVAAPAVAAPAVAPARKRAAKPLPVPPVDPEPVGNGQPALTTSSTQPGPTSTPTDKAEPVGNGQPAPAAESPDKEPTGSATTAATAPSAARDATPATATPSPSELPRSADPIPGIEQEEKPDEELAVIVGAHEEKVNAWLIRSKNIKVDQTYRSCPTATRNRILKNPAGFIDLVTKA